MNIAKTDFTKIFLLLFIAIFFASCATDKEEENTAELTYTKAKKLLDDKNYSESAKEFEKIDDEFPFSIWAKKGQVMAIYAHYKNDDFEKIIPACENFIKLNPASEYVPYVMYMKGLAYYDQIPSIDRAQDNTQIASFTFRELIARFPDSSYASDATEKLTFIDEHLAGYKMSVGRYEMNNKNYVGALDHFNNVISRYHTSKQVPEAYFRLNEIYQKVGIKDEAAKALTTLQNEFPENFWTKLALQEDEEK